MAIGGGKFSNTTASAAVGQWRQFSGAMQQLQESKGAMTQVVAPKFEPERFNLAGSLLDVMEGANDAYDNIKKIADKNAQEWANGKSFQEVANEMKENKVPFQYDPFAMASLATIQGRNAFNIGMMEFNDRLKTDEFIDMSPEEIDQVFIDHQRKVAADLGEAHGSLGSSGAFLNGFWVDANKTREYVWKTSETVKDDFRKQQGQIAAESQINELLDGSVDDLYSGLTMLMQSGVAGRMPEDAMKVAKSTIEAIAKHPQGATKIQELADRNVPGLGDVTYRRLFGDAVINATMVKAENVALIDDFAANQALTDTLNSMLMEGDIGGIRALGYTLAQQAGGQQTDATKMVQQYENAYYRGLKSETNKLSDKAKDQIRQGTLAAYSMAIRSGAASGDQSPAGQTLYDADGNSMGTPKHEHLQEIWRQSFMSGTMTPIEIERMVQDEDGKAMFKTLFQDIYGEVKSEVKAIASGYKNPDSITEPNGIKQILSYIQLDPTRMSGLVNYDQADALDLIGFMAEGRSFKEYIAAKAAMEKRTLKEKLEANLPIQTRDVTTDNSHYESMYVQRLAMVKIGRGMDANKAISDAKTEFKQTHQIFSYRSPHVDTSGWVFNSSRDESEVYVPTSFYQQFTNNSKEEVDTALTSFIASIEAKFDNQDLYFEYDSFARGIRVYSPDILEESFLFDGRTPIVTSEETPKVEKPRYFGMMGFR